MRSELVTQAATAVRNRYLLVHVATAITRKFHRSNIDRLTETLNSALSGLGSGEYVVWPGTAFVALGGRALIESHLDGAEDTSTLAAFTSLSTGLPYFPPQSVPAEAEAAAETA